MDTDYELMLPLHFVTASLGIYDNQRLILLYTMSTNLYNSFFALGLLLAYHGKKLGNCDMYTRVRIPLHRKFERILRATLAE